MTDGQERIDGRIDNLETQLAYQNEVIDVLNKTVVEQWAKLDQAFARIKHLEDRLREIQLSIVRDAADEVPPPHY
jgi:SlyX protein